MKSVRQINLCVESNKLNKTETDSDTQNKPMVPDEMRVGGLGQKGEGFGIYKLGVAK